MRDRLGAGIDRVGQVRAEEVNQRHHHEPGKNAAGKDDSGNAGSDDVAHSEIFRRDIGADGRALEPIRLIVRRARPCAKEIVVLEERIDSAEPEPEKDAAGKGAAVLAREQHIRAGRAFRIGERAVFLDDELTAQRDHEEHAEPAADQREKKDARVFEIEAEKDQRRQREDHTGRNGLPGIAGGLDDVVLKNRGPAKRAQHADGEHRYRNRCRDRQTRAQPDIDRDSAKENAEE